MQRFPKDEVIIGDALEYVRFHWSEFEFIWSSPPCQSHSQLNQFRVNDLQNPPMIPDYRTLYGQIDWFKVVVKEKIKWVVENVNSEGYHALRMDPNARIGRHIFWSNFLIPSKILTPPLKFFKYKDQYVRMAHDYGINLDEIPSHLKRTVLRNCVDGKIGQYVLNCAIRPKRTLNDFFLNTVNNK